MWVRVVVLGRERVRRLACNPSHRVERLRVLEMVVFMGEGKVAGVVRGS